MKYSKLSLQDIDNATNAMMIDRISIDVTVKTDSIAADLHINSFLDQNDAAVIFYVAGYCCCSLVKGNKCDSCKETTVASIDIGVDDKISTLIPADVTQFFNYINRGGLWKPNKQTFHVGTLCWQVFAELSTKNELQQQFLSSLNQPSVFQEIVTVIFYENSSGYTLSFPTMCAKGYNFF